MDFRTVVNPSLKNSKLSLSHSFFTIGSCFADTIGRKLHENKFTVSANPFGTVYNPISIHKLLVYSLQNQTPSADSYATRDDVFVNYDFHSEVSSPSRAELENDIQTRIGQAHHFLKKAHTILITYGTAWIYQRNDTHEPVANCHKLPASSFTKRLLSVDEICHNFQRLYEVLQSAHPGLKIILTVSPVRHLKDTLELNAVSKSVLRLSLHNIIQQFDDVEYFPAYEIMLDDLRDYRFYQSDLLHPNELAEEYIWDNFSNCCFTRETLALLAKWKSVQQMLLHKAFHPQSQAHQKFLKETLRKLEELKNIFPVEEEIKTIQSKIL